MNLLEQTKKICNKYNIKPARSKGQNFLINESVYDEIIKSADLKKDDVVLEVGPGLGFLTEKLAEKVKKVIAVELDDKLVKVLQFRMTKYAIGNVKIINEDVLKIQNSKLNYLLKIQNLKLKIVANLPYNITSIFLRKFLSAEIKPTSMVLMLQKEVAERICAKPPKMSLLSVSVQFYANPKIIQNISANCFWPKPAVDSAIIKLNIKSPSGSQTTEWLNTINENDFFKLVKKGFSSRRKMLKNNLANDYYNIEDKLKKNNFNPKIRAQELSVDNWKKIFGEFI